MTRITTNTPRAGESAEQTAARGNRRQKLVVGRLVDGQLHVITDVLPFVSSRLGTEIVSRETNEEHESEWHRVAAAATSKGAAS